MGIQADQIHLEEKMTKRFHYSKNSCLYLSSLLCMILMLTSALGNVASAQTQEAGSALQITEFMALDSTLADEDGDYSDWLEIYNSGTADVNLGGWYLTDTPRNLTQWSFPAVTVDAGDYLVIFASGKDRKTPTLPLHTNFRLNGDGEYLALVGPDGVTIAHEYAPQFPDQHLPKEGYSYGLSMGGSTIVADGAPVKAWIPQDDSLGAEWLSPSFNDANWISGKTSVGYGSETGSFNVTTYLATLIVPNLSRVETIIDTASLQESVSSESATTINYTQGGSTGRYDGIRPFPGLNLLQDVNDFVILATASIHIPEGGTWTFGINSDDGARLRIDGADVIVDDDTHAERDTFGSLGLSTGVHELELLYFQRSGDAALELFAAPGRHTSYDPSVFRLVGDVADGGIPLAGFGETIALDLEERMKDKSSSVYLRIPFQVSDPSEVDMLTLVMRYSDGFAAYMNGEKIAQRHTPDSLEWNSKADLANGSGRSVYREEFTITDSLRALQPGINVLAIQGLSSSENDTSFLIAPELRAFGVFSQKKRYFGTPTPGSVNEGGIVGFVAAPQLSHRHGFYDNPFELSMACQTEDAAIRYTLDGTAPTARSGFIYTEPIHVETTTTLRVGAFRSDLEPSRIVSYTYIFVDDVIHQTRPPGYPTVWGGGVSGQYDMDPDVVDDPRYKTTIREDLKSLPAVSIVMDPANLFDRTKGIYVNPENRGVNWERPSSTELIFPDGREGFHINNGVRIQGGYSRVPRNRKHSFRLLFKRDYGPPTLRYRLFDNSHVDRFDTIVLRGNYNYTWHSHEGGFGSNIGRADYIRDEFSRRTQLATGQVASHGTYVHLYLNGMYWGVYNLCERPDDAFSAEHLGGEKEEWDVVTGGTRGLNRTQVKAGNKEAWNNMMDLADEGRLEDPEKYREIQEYLNVGNIIDYMLTIFYTGNRDAPTVIGGGGTPWNFYSSRRRLPGAGYRFYCWDSEWTLEEPDRNVVTFHKGNDTPARVFNRLKDNSDFLILLADHIQRHFFNDGAFTPEVSGQRYSEVVDLLDRAIVGESARWGDANSSRPRTRDDDWIPETERILEEYLPVRTQYVVDQLRTAGLYPNVGAPELSRHGGVVDKGFPLTMEVAATPGTNVERETLIRMTDVWKYEQSGRDLGTGWRHSDYDDSSWPSGKALLYVENSFLPEQKNTSLQLGETTYYFRTRFTVDSSIDLEEVSLELSTILDDGAIVYLNGREIYRIGMPGGVVTHSTFASRTVTNGAYEGPFRIGAEHLRIGENVLAAEVHQTNANSSDVVFGLSLTGLLPIKEGEEPVLPIYYTTDGSDPRLPGGEINSDSASVYRDAISLNDNTHIKARTYDDGTWSALTDTWFFIAASGAEVASLENNLRVTEVMYNPAPGEGFEFMEFHNTHSSSPLPLYDLLLTGGIDYRFPPNAQIPPNGYLLLARLKSPEEEALFRRYYRLNGDVTILGPYSGRLSNAGDEITLKTKSENSEIISFIYRDDRGWPVAPDGAGHSLVSRSSAMAAQSSGSLNYGGNWRQSTLIGGSPGRKDSDPSSDVLLNEFAANTVRDTIDASIRTSNDWIEIYNPTNEEILLENWYLSDDPDNLKKWRIPDSTVPPGEYVVYEEVSDFNAPGTDGFTLNDNGERIYLSHQLGGIGVDRVVDAVRFSAQKLHRSLGRQTDASPYWVAMPLTPDTSNEALPDDIVVDEFVLHLREDRKKNFVELYNPTDREVNLWNEHGGWSLRGDIEFLFRAGRSIPPGGRLVVVAFDPEDLTSKRIFMEFYGLTDTAIQLAGPFSGPLNAHAGRIAIEEPRGDLPGLNQVAWGVVDEVLFFDQAPWPADFGGQGNSLQRQSSAFAGNDPANWRPASPTPGGSATSIEFWHLH